MKRCAVLLLSLIILATIAYSTKGMVDVTARNLHTDWALEQTKKCSNIGTLLYQYYEKHGHYPEALHELVDSKMIDESAFRELKFQRTASAEPQDWRYSKPNNPSDFALFSGDPVTGWNCPTSSYIAGKADGSVIVFGKEKLPTMTRNHLRPNQLTD